ncbi:MAG: AAA family ATPase [Bacteroidota bacterium]|nr:AAA family ATPase [Bacteroidota bacterium]
MTFDEEKFDFTLTSEQRQAVQSILEFIHNDEKQVFILRGYAGTGKTSLLKGISKLLDDDVSMHFWATTGRAAKIISSKTNLQADTIHRSIYRLRLSEEDKKNRIIKLYYELIKNNHSLNTFYAIDECSQLSDKKTLTLNLNFGTGRLLADTLEYAGGRKILFIGDNAQLPPVKYMYSPALNPDYFQKHHQLSAKHFDLTEIKRFDKTSGIYKNTRQLREHIADASYPKLSIRASGMNDIRVYHNESEMVKTFVKLARQSGIDNLKFITLSNKKANWLNLQIRQQLYKGKKPQVIRENDVLMVTQNNYLYDLMNGDSAQVTWVNPKPIFKAGFKFREVQVKFYDPKAGAERTRKVILFEDLLQRDKNNLTDEEDYKIRHYLFAKANELGIDKNTCEFNEFVRNEPYANALRVGYGYASTCHKAQGGEWDHVFIMLEFSMFYFPLENQYRWTYTALTRSRKQIHILDNYYIR